MMVFCSVTGQASVGYHLLIDKKTLPSDLARKWCVIFDRVNALSDESMREKTLQRILINQDSSISNLTNLKVISYCRSCIQHKTKLDSRCLKVNDVGLIQKYASFL
jgi:hypothetical protein